MRRPGASYRGPSGLSDDNAAYADRRDTYRPTSDFYQTSIMATNASVITTNQTVFAVLPKLTSEITITQAKVISLGTSDPSVLTKLLVGIYVLDAGKSTISFLPNSFVTLTGTSGNGVTPASLTGVFQTPTGFTLYPDNQYFLWYYLLTPATQDFYGARGKTFTNGAGQTPVPVVQLSTRQAVSNTVYDVIPSITFTSDRGATFYKDI